MSRLFAGTDAHDIAKDDLANSHMRTPVLSLLKADAWSPEVGSAVEDRV